MRRFPLFVALTLLPFSASAMEIVMESKPVAHITLAPDATQCEQLAAQELVKYIRLMTGAELTIANADSEPAIYIGKAAEGKGLLPRLPEDFGWDSFAIVVSGRKMCIYGGGDAGTLFGVYAFLESLGCRWLAPGEENEFIPNLKNISVSDCERIEIPAFKERLFYVRTEDAMNWAVKNRINGFYTQEFARAHGNLLYLPPFVRSIHSFVKLLPPEEYFDKHPEYYALINGERRPADMRGVQICTTNPEVIEIIAAKVRRYFKETPDARVFSIAPNDGYGWCECERCRGLDEKLCHSKKWFHNPAQPVVSDRLCVFANAVAKKALFDMPDKELYMFAYVSYCEPPVTARPDPRVTHVVCHYIPACYAHPVNDETCPDNVIYNKIIKGWRKISPQMMTYAYTDKSQWLGLPRPVVRQMATDIKYFNSLGIKKYIAQSGALNWSQMGALYYVTAKLLWNPKQDTEQIIRDWNQHFYGEAAEEMMRFYDALEEVVRKSGGHYRGNPYEQVPNVYTATSLDPLVEHLKRALQAASDEKSRSRIQKVSDKFEYGRLGVKVICLSQQWEDKGDVKALEEARRCARRILELHKGWGGISMMRFREFLESVAAESPDAVRWSGWGEPETKGGRQCRNSDETGPGDDRAGWASFSKIIRDRTRPYVVTMTVWGESDDFSLVICKEGKGKGTAEGGVWVPLEKEGELSGKPEWCTLRFHVAPELFDKESARQRFGFGGRDSQVWVADIAIEPE